MLAVLGVAGTSTAMTYFGRDATVGEAVFAPSSPDAAEDDGYLMAFVHKPAPVRDCGLT